MKPSDIIRIVAGRTFPSDWYEVLAAYAILYRQYRQLLATHRYSGRTEIWDRCIETIGAGKDVLFLEFGVWQGQSTQYFSSQLHSLQTRFWGFDSFEGLPENWFSHPKGYFSVNGVMPKIDDTRVQFVKGWFQQSFDNGLQRAKKSIPAPSSVFIHFDADLYSSTLFLLTSLHRQFDQYYFLFDEFMSQECRALYNFQQAYGCKIEFLAYSSSESPFPEHVFGKITNR